MREGGDRGGGFREGGVRTESEVRAMRWLALKMAEGALSHGMQAASDWKQQKKEVLPWSIPDNIFILAA